MELALLEFHTNSQLNCVAVLPPAPAASFVWKMAEPESDTLDMQSCEQKPIVPL